jgi:hypothetical protein
MGVPEVFLRSVASEKVDLLTTPSKLPQELPGFFLCSQLQPHANDLGLITYSIYMQVETVSILR